MLKNLEVLSRSSFEPLYHYTSFEAMYSMIKENTFWATNCEYQDDHLESRHMEKLYCQLHNDKNICNMFLQYIDKLKEEDEQKLKTERELMYLFSFTTDENSEYMWKNYAKNGVIIEFDSFGLLDTYFSDENINFLDRNDNILLLPSEIIFGKVKYDDNEIKSLLHQLYIFETGKNNFYQNIDLSLKTFLKYDGLRYFKKDESFRKENEYRLVIRINDNERLRHINKNKNPNVPFIKIKFNNIGYYIKNIIINQRINNINEETVKTTLKNIDASLISKLKTIV